MGFDVGEFQILLHAFTIINISVCKSDRSFNWLIQLIMVILMTGEYNPQSLGSF